MYVIILVWGRAGIESFYSKKQSISHATIRRVYDLGRFSGEGHLLVVMASKDFITMNWRENRSEERGFFRRSVHHAWKFGDRNKEAWLHNPERWKQFRLPLKVRYQEQLSLVQLIPCPIHILNPPWQVSDRATPLQRWCKDSRRWRSQKRSA